MKFLLNGLEEDSLFFRIENEKFENIIDNSDTFFLLERNKEGMWEIETNKTAVERKDIVEKFKRLGLNVEKYNYCGICGKWLSHSVIKFLAILSEKQAICCICYRNLRLNKRNP